MSHFNFYSILFNLQTHQQENSPLAVQPIRRSYQVLLCLIKEKQYQTYSRFETFILKYRVNDFYRFLYICNTQKDLYCSNCFFYFKHKSQRKSMMLGVYLKSLILFLIQSFCSNFANYNNNIIILSTPSTFIEGYLLLPPCPLCKILLPSRDVF